MDCQKLHLFVVESNIDTTSKKRVSDYLSRAFSESEMQKIFASDSEGKEIVVCNLDPFKVNLLGNFISDLGILIDSYDITEMVIGNKLDANITSFIQDSDCNKMAVDRFIYDNLSVDDILDKISMNGIGSITDLEMEFLNRQSL